MKLYREVKCSDRLPEEGELVFGYIYMEGSKLMVVASYYEESGWQEHLDEENILDVESWLEPYELPTVEEIEEEAAKRYGDGPNVLSSQQWKAFKRGAKWIVNLLKGER